MPRLSHPSSFEHSEAHLVISTRYEARNYTLFCTIIFLLLICFVPLVGKTNFHTHIKHSFGTIEEKLRCVSSNVWVSTELGTSTSPLISCLYGSNEDSNVTV
jgi:hypothetical protein